MNSDGEDFVDNESDTRQVEDSNPNDTDDDMADIDEEEQTHVFGDTEEPLEPVSI